MAIASGEDGVDGVDDFGAATVIDGDGEDHAGVFGSGVSVASRVSLRTASGSSSGRPRKRKRILLRWRRGISLRMYSRRSCMRNSISVLGRRQFSTEKA